MMGQAYPDLAEAQQRIETTLHKEEVRFGETLDKGMKLLNTAIADLEGKVLPGDVVFKLYDTFGFPVDLTTDIARENEIEVDEAGFNSEMDAQREAARAAGKFGVY
jgi:alanyl-tRNA synthetase